MTDAAQKFDLLETYVKLDDGGSGAIVEVDDAFWQEIDARPQFQYGRLVMKARFTSDWPTWEIHPAGPELVLLLEGEVEFVLRVANRDEVVRLERGDTCLVPTNTWHTARVLAPSEMLFITPCTGTRNAPQPE